jgi:hypothetical protein
VRDMSAAGIFEMANLGFKPFLKCADCGAVKPADEWSAGEFIICGDGCCHSEGLMCQECYEIYYVSPFQHTGDASLSDILVGDAADGPFEKPVDLTPPKVEAPKMQIPARKRPEITEGWWWVRDTFSGSAEIVQVSRGIAGADLRYYRIEDLRAHPMADLAKRYEVLSRIPEPA